jgi:hypothetical protein
MAGRLIFFLLVINNPAESASFLQKKKQKNSYLLRVAALAGKTSPVSKSFLLLFFKKEALAFLSQNPAEA